MVRIREIARHSIPKYHEDGTLMKYISYDRDGYLVMIHHLNDNGTSRDHEYYTIDNNEYYRREGEYLNYFDQM